VNRCVSRRSNDALHALHAHLTSCGYELKPPANTSYGLRQLSVDDPDGYELCFTAPQKVG
jgi:hypothetical protein